MKFLIDAQLPRRLAVRSRDTGHDAVHTLDLPLKNKTPDHIIEEISLRERRVVVTKDADFVNAFTLFRKPYKLLLVATGNINNTDLEKLFFDNIEQIVDAFERHRFIEINRLTITFHE